MSIIIEGDDLMHIAVHYIIKTNKLGFKSLSVLDDEQYKVMSQDEEKAKQIKTLNTKWKPQTWQAQNDLLTRSSVYNPASGNKEIDWTRFRDARLKSCLVDWDATDSEGRNYPVNDDTINAMHANIAMALSNKYDAATSISEDEAGK